MKLNHLTDFVNLFLNHLTDLPLGDPISLFYSGSATILTFFGEGEQKKNSIAKNESYLNQAVCAVPNCISCNLFF